MKTEKQNNIVVQSAEPSELEAEWLNINWYKVKRGILKIQQRIYRANMLEPIVLKGTRWVLRRGRVSNHSDLSDFVYI